MLISMGLWDTMMHMQYSSDSVSNVLHTRRMLYQQSHQGSSTGQAESLKFIQGKGRLSPDEQGNSISDMYISGWQRVKFTHSMLFLDTCTIITCQNLQQKLLNIHTYMDTVCASLMTSVIVTLSVCTCTTHFH